MHEPRLEIERVMDPGPEPKYDTARLTVTVDGREATADESEAAAVLIRCMREGWGFARWTGADSDNTERLCQIEAHHSFVTRLTPAEAYEAARDEESNPTCTCGTFSCPDCTPPLDSDDR